MNTTIPEKAVSRRSQEEAPELLPARMFDVELRGSTVIVTPTRNLGELEFQAIEAEAKGVLAFLDRVSARSVIVDLRRMDYSGSTALGFFVQLAAQVRGHMALCNVSEHEREIFHLTHLEGRWPTYPSLEEALPAISA